MQAPIVLGNNDFATHVRPGSTPPTSTVSLSPLESKIPKALTGAADLETALCKLANEISISHLSPGACGKQ